MTATPKAKLPNLPTAELIAQYDLAVASYAGRMTNHSPRQKRVDYIVSLLSDRADNDDAAALAWYAA